MSTTRTSGGTDEALFVIGVLGGTLVLGLGFVFLILGLSVGVKEIGMLSTGQSRTFAMVAGIAGIASGVGLRFVRHRLDDGLPQEAFRHGGSGVAFVGTTALLVGLSAEQTNSAPFLTSMQQKIVLVMFALATIVAGLLVIRLAGRRIGW